MGIGTPTPAATVEPAGAAIEFPDNRLLVDLCGSYDRNLAHIEQRLGVQILRRGNQLQVLGAPPARQRAEKGLRALYARLEQGTTLGPGDIDDALSEPVAHLPPAGPHTGPHAIPELHTRKKVITPKTEAQAAYVARLFASQLLFGIGPAGTGKTYLAVAAGVSLFNAGTVERIILSRPAVEAGERLGFLPGDMKEKVDPYMQPLYDALHDFLPARQVERLIAERRIEIAPLAFMRGRTLSGAFVLLDEAQNTTPMQMKMFLTRLGEGSRMVITGDRTQVDLPRGTPSGLVEAERILAGVKGVDFSHFTADDVVRHPLVARIIRAYEQDAVQDRPRGV